MNSTRPPPASGAWLAAAGALAAAAGVALSAYAAHAATDASQARLQTAALFAFGHGLALAALAPGATRRLVRFALATLLLGMLLFSGSLAASVLLHATTAPAPAGGLMMILGWLMLAFHFLRR
jgi:uncharacterized membrane protein YgdD (TMEM256/DUF423 family)